MNRQWAEKIALASLLATAWGCDYSKGIVTGDSVVGNAQTSQALLFCTQVPNPADFTAIGSTFGNHLGTVQACPRGGDLWIRYADGSLRNLTQTAGYGEEGLQGAHSIAVREPCVHWSGTKALFSMIIGSPGQYEPSEQRWQIYEITGFEPAATPVITKVAHQPDAYNNVSPIYASDDKILFTSDRPRDGQAHLYPQLDEYEEAPSVTGIWKLDPVGGALEILNHTPSGAFSPSVDSYGRVVFARWDHLVRDQQADDDNICNCDQFGTFNYTSEAPGSVSTGNNDEVFPEPRGQWIGHVDGHMPNFAGPLHDWKSYLVGSEINHFFPWTMTQNGAEEETLNHVGRHELHTYLPAARDDDPSLVSQLFMGPFTANRKPITNLIQLREDPRDPGTYFGTNAPEFFTHGAGQIVRIHAPPGLEADALTVDYVTHPETANFDATPGPNHTGMYRNPLPLADGTWIASHAATSRQAGNDGSFTHPDPVYKFRLKTLVQSGSFFRAGAPLTQGLSKSVQWYSPDQLITYGGPLWELWPCEVIARSAPPSPAPTLAAPEQQVLDQKGVALSTLKDYLRTNGLALIISRNVTRRDRNDVQQPYNLRVAGSATETVSNGGTVYDVAHLQLFQADSVRGLTMGTANPIPGRRVLPRPLHDGLAANPANPSGPAGSVQIAPDGSMAALVPAKRALSWQLTDPAGEPVVRERYWVTFQPGEVRTCVACHGLSSADQQGNLAPTNPPQALGQLLQHLLDDGAL